LKRAGNFELGVGIDGDIEELRNPEEWRKGRIGVFSRGLGLSVKGDGSDIICDACPNSSCFRPHY
jgi:hypothetical protein